MKAVCKYFEDELITVRDHLCFLLLAKKQVKRSENFVGMFPEIRELSEKALLNIFKVESAN